MTDHGLLKIFAAVADHVKATLTPLGSGVRLLIELLAQMKKTREQNNMLWTGKTSAITLSSSNPGQTNVLEAFHMEEEYGSFIDST
jgi:hypothetical protein